MKRISHDAPSDDGHGVVAVSDGGAVYAPTARSEFRIAKAEAVYSQDDRPVPEETPLNIVGMTLQRFAGLDLDVFARHVRHVNRARMTHPYRRVRHQT